METNEENVIWSGHPSQLLNFWIHLVDALLVVGILAGAILSGIPLIGVFVIFPIAWSVWKYLVIRCRVYQLTSERLRLFEGVLNQKIGEVELYRVKDTNICLLYTSPSPRDRG